MNKRIGRILNTTLAPRHSREGGNPNSKNNSFFVWIPEQAGNDVTLTASGSESRSRENGYFLVSVVVMILFLTAIGVSIAALTAAQYTHTKRKTYVQNAILVAEAGIEQSVHKLNTDDSFSGYASPQQFFDNDTQGRGTFTTSVTTNADGSSKTIISTGKIYRHSGDTNPYLTRKIKVTAVGTSSSGYSVSSGPGGLILGGSANITNSNVYVNGTITMHGASRIGSNDNPVNVDVANKACPKGSNPGSSYPEVCTDGSQPISMDYSTDIYGTVCATGQTDKGPRGDNISGGNGGAGLKPGCTAPDVQQPKYNRGAQIAGVTTTGSGSSNAYTCQHWPFDRSWPANLKLTGNVRINQTCNVTIHGNVYITGNLTIGGASKIRVADSVGKKHPVVIVDGTIKVGGSGSMIANSDGTGIKFISYKNATGNPAATPTGTALKQSQGMQTVTIGGAVKLPGMIFDAYWSKIKIAGSGKVGAAAGQTVDMSGAGNIVFGTELSSGSKTWTITSYQRIY
jgi:Tfp pilus assembly protein PilX